MPNLYWFWILICEDLLFVMKKAKSLGLAAVGQTKQALWKQGIGIWERDILTFLVIQLYNKGTVAYYTVFQKDRWIWC